MSPYIFVHICILVVLGGILQAFSVKCMKKEVAERNNSIIGDDLKENSSLVLNEFLTPPYLRFITVPLTIVDVEINQYVAYFCVLSCLLKF